MIKRFGKKIVMVLCFFHCLFLMSCESQEDSIKKDYWSINFSTSKKPGICYYSYKEFINTDSGHLTFQNRNNFSIHLIIFNETKNGKIEYEADLDAGGILSFYNISRHNDYSVGIRVADGPGINEVSVLVYDNYNLVPYVLE